MGGQVFQRKATVSYEAAGRCKPPPGDQRRGCLSPYRGGLIQHSWPGGHGRTKVMLSFKDWRSGSLTTAPGGWCPWSGPRAVRGWFRRRIIVSTWAVGPAGCPRASTFRSPGSSGRQCVPRRGPAACTGTIKACQASGSRLGVFRIPAAGDQHPARPLNGTAASITLAGFRDMAPFLLPTAGQIPSLLQPGKVAARESAVHPPLGQRFPPPGGIKVRGTRRLPHGVDAGMQPVNGPDGSASSSWLRAPGPSALMDLH